MPNSHFKTHIDRLRNLYQEALEHSRQLGESVNAVLIHSGSQQYYYADDQEIAFRAFGHFLHWLPVNRADQFVFIQADKRPIYFQLVPDDFWYDQSINIDTEVSEQFSVIRINQLDSLLKYLPDNSDIAFLGESLDIAKLLKINSSAINPKHLLHFLNFHRAIKSEYEIEQLRVANATALIGHKAARHCFLNNGNELDIHRSYLSACNIIETQSPYTNIVALDEKSAILHYQHKRNSAIKNSQVLLIDAGFAQANYCSDITRTWVRGHCHEVFKSLVEQMHILELELVNAVVPGMAYPQLHALALEKIAGLLISHDICNSSQESLLANHIPQLFMPHGVGHLLGLQVHDVGGRQQNINGDELSAPTHSPALRNTRTLCKDMVFTVEPGLYFIPLLLDPHRNTKLGQCINFSLVDSLIPCGGIRIEDNIRVTDTGAENLTRQFESYA